jgi:hypothetical protein
MIRLTHPQNRKYGESLKRNPQDRLTLGEVDGNGKEAVCVLRRKPDIDRLLEEFPDYRTQGETLDERQENITDIYGELTSGRIPAMHRVGERPQQAP